MFYQMAPRVDTRRPLGGNVNVVGPKLGDHAFHSWAVILVGAVLFAALFGLLTMIMDLIFEGEFRMTVGIMGFGMIAFVG